VERGLAIFAVLWQIAWSATDIAPRVLADGQPIHLVLFGATTVTWLLLAATVWGPRAWRRARPTAILLDVAVLAVAAATYSVMIPAADAWPVGTIAAVRAGVVATLLMRPLPGALIAVGIAATSGVILFVGPATLSLVDTMMETLYAVALATGALVLGNGLRRSGRRLEAAHELLAAEEGARLAREALARATANHERQIHDQVLNTLAAIGRGGLAQAELVRARCAGGASALRMVARDLEVEGTADDADLALLERELAAAPGDWSVHVDVPRDVLEGLPPHVVQAMAGAAAEAARNAFRHSCGSALIVRIDCNAGTWTMTVEDDGRGIPEDAVPGLGMRTSISGVMADCGGIAQWQALPAGGTRVVLRWTEPAEPVSGAARTIEADALTLLPGIGPPFLLTFLGYGALVLVAAWTSYAAPMWALGWWILAAVVASVVGGVPDLTARLGLTGGPRWSPRVLWGVALALASTPAILQMGIAAVGDATVPVWASWSSAMALALVFVAILLGPPWTVAPVLVVWVIAQGGGLMELTQPGTLMLVIAAIFAASMRRRARAYAQANAAIIDEQAAVAAVTADERRRAQRFRPLLEHTVVLLEEISNGTLDPHDVQVRERCQQEELVARSIVRVDRDSGELAALLHDSVTSARSAGRFLDADLMGEWSDFDRPLPASALVAVKSEVASAVVGDLPVGGQARLTAGWEDNSAVVRMVMEAGEDDVLREWVIGSD